VLIALRVVVGLAGAALVVAISLSAVRTVVLPRGSSAAVTRYLFRTTRKLFELRLRTVKTYEERDRVMALYAPISLVLLPGVWLVAVIMGFAGIFWGIQGHSVRAAIVLSGSSITTLGFSAPHGDPADIGAVVEATIGLGLVALLISYLPSIYSGFQRRELQVAMLEVRAGDPPSAVKMIRRHQAIGWLDTSSELFARWEEWFADIEETHTSQASLVFFRSPLPGRSWITAAGAVLDGAALMLSAVDNGPTPNAQLCVRAGFLSLRRIADYFGIGYDPDPAPTDPISIDRSEFDAAVAELRDGGVPIVADLEQAWRDFAGWRVNYDQVLLALAGLVMAPYAPWSSDRSVRVPLGPLTHRHPRRRAG